AAANMRNVSSAVSPNTPSHRYAQKGISIRYVGKVISNRYSLGGCIARCACPTFCAEIRLPENSPDSGVSVQAPEGERRFAPEARRAIASAQSRAGAASDDRQRNGMA